MVRRYHFILFSLAVVGFTTYFAISQKTISSEYSIAIQSACDVNEPKNSSIPVLFSHGYVRNTYGTGKKQVQRFIKNNICNGPTWFFEYNDTDERTNLAQELDCQCLYEAHQQVTANDNDCIIVGLSRGGSTALMFAAQYKPTNVKAIIVESPFAHIDDVAYCLGIQYAPWAPFKKQLALWAMRYLFPLFNPSYTQPIDIVTSIDHTIPLLFICSEQDDLVPAASTLKLVHALRASGHPHVYAVVLPEGEHGYLSYNEHIQTITNAFLAQYNLEHGADYAALGHENLITYYQDPFKEAHEA